MGRDGERRASPEDCIFIQVPSIFQVVSGVRPVVASVRPPADGDMQDPELCGTVRKQGWCERAVDRFARAGPGLHFPGSLIGVHLEMQWSCSVFRG